jgi:hypothetical protein
MITIFRPYGALDLMSSLVLNDISSLRDLGFMSSIVVKDMASLRDWAEHGCLIVNRISSLLNLGFMSSIVVKDMAILPDLCCGLVSHVYRDSVHEGLSIFETIDLLVP